MLKSELDNLIQPAVSTEEEFNLVEKLYMASDSMTKKEAAKIWKTAFSKAWEARHKQDHVPPAYNEILTVVRAINGLHGKYTKVIRDFIIYLESFSNPDQSAGYTVRVETISGVTLQKWVYSNSILFSIKD